MISREINVNACAATATYVPTLLSEIKKVLKPWKTLTELVILGYFSETYFCDKAPSHTHAFSWSIDVCRVWKPKERTKNYSTDLVFIWCKYPQGTYYKQGTKISSTSNSGAGSLLLEGAAKKKFHFFLEKESSFHFRNFSVLITFPFPWIKFITY